MELQQKAKKLCWEYNKTSPEEKEERSKILKELLGTYNPLVFIEPSFRCDYGFNIHTKGFAFINYNCVILDTSPVNIGKGVFIAPGVCIACSGHAIHPRQRAEGIGTSKPITIEDNVWIGANSTVCGGVTIEEGSIIGGQAEHCREHQRTEKNRDDLLHGNSPFFLSVQDRFINKYYTISYCIKQHRTAPCTAN